MRELSGMCQPCIDAAFGGLMALDRNKIDRNKNNISKRLEDEDDIKQVAKQQKKSLCIICPRLFKDQSKTR